MKKKLQKKVSNLINST